MSRRTEWRKSRTATFHVYVLVDPRDGLPHYVGCTMDPRRRLWSHLSAPVSTEGNRRRHALIQELRQAGLRPKMLGLGEAVGYRAAMGLEEEWISKGIKRGWPLLNGHLRGPKRKPGLEPYMEAP